MPRPFDDCGSTLSFSPMADQKTAEFDDLLKEHRVFPPSAAFRARAIANDESIYAEAERDPEGFWAGFAGELEWSRKWDRVLDWQPPHAKWFVGGKINASVNCVDRHVRGPRRNKAAQRLLRMTADGGYRRGQIVPLKQVADEALAGTPSIENVVVVQRGGGEMPIHIKEGRDHWYHRVMQDASLKCDPEPMDAE